MQNGNGENEQPLDENELQFQAALNSQIDRMAFDPKQDKGERRRLRREYRTLIGETEGHKRELVSGQVAELDDTMKRGNTLFKQVRNPLEAMLDSRLFTIAADIATQKARNVNIGQGAFDADEFISKVKRLGGDVTQHDQELDWKKIGMRAAEHSHRVESIDFMLGPLMTERKERKVGNRRNAIQISNNAVKPTQLEESDLQHQENETSANVNQVYRILHEGGPYNFLQFVTNPTSFSQTVENMFYVSFLIRNAVAEIDDSTGEPMLSTCAPPTEDQITQGVSKAQLIMDMDMALWEEIIQTYSIQNSIIPTRTKSALAVTGSKWY